VTTKGYRGAAIDVLFDGARCLHAAECVRGLPSVFDPERRPWIDPDGASAEAVADVVRRCPSGALRIAGEHPPEAAERPTTIVAAERAPLFVRGELLLEIDGEPQAETRAALCCCGATANRPFCDGSGDCRGWH
jgi:uncharacterized Fe-S cluster protein YjdI/CDGSH-type Zn-finger protein